MEVIEKLTPREQEILDSLAEGLSNRAIAERYSLALASVKWYNNQIFSKLGSRSRAEAVERARELGLLTAQPERSQTNLPLELTSLVGREAELAEIAGLLENPAARLLTLIGAGGCGKTRLALRAGADLGARFSNGVWLVELAPLSEPERVPWVVVSALNLAVDPNRPPLEELERKLRERETLIILDNCEHLIAAAAQLADALLRACPRLRILATSREPLGVPGEVTYRVPSLRLPPPDWDGVSTSSAVQLFLERAASTHPGFTLADGDRAAVARICRRLDGIPLAIELAAARVSVLPVQVIAERLDDAFHLLTGGSRTVLERQQTLRGSIDWSYRLLDPLEQTLLARLSVFAGGWNLEAAEAVCADPHDGLARADILDRLASLVNKSLVTADTGRREPRYRMLEVMRQYSQEKLEQSGEAAAEHADAVRERHYQWCMAFASSADAGVVSAERRYWTARVEEELPNMRQALTWSLTGRAAPGSAHRLINALTQFWQMRGYSREGMDWLQAAMARTDGVPQPVLANTYLRGCFLAMQLLDMDRAQHCAEKALAICQSTGEVENTATALSDLGYVAFMRGDFERARAFAAQSLELYEKLDLTFGKAVVLLQMAEMAFLEGDLPLAESTLAEGLAICRQVGNEMGAVRRIVRQSQIASARGDVERAQALLDEGTRAALGSGDRWIVQMITVAAASLAIQQKKLVHAARSLGAAHAFLETFGTFLFLVDKRLYDQHREFLMGRMGEAAFTAAWEEGRASGAHLEAALNFVLRELNR